MPLWAGCIGPKGSTHSMNDSMTVDDVRQQHDLRGKLRPCTAIVANASPLVSYAHLGCALTGMSAQQGILSCAAAGPHEPNYFVYRT